MLRPLFASGTLAQRGTISFIDQEIYPHHFRAVLWLAVKPGDKTRPEAISLLAKSYGVQFLDATCDKAAARSALHELGERYITLYEQFITGQLSMSGPT